jgi:PleD family two-component response regulator
VRAADHALYRAKDAGRDRVMVAQTVSEINPLEN